MSTFSLAYCGQSEDGGSREADSVVPASLSTHIRPLKVAVDLVLVPVTITDPMNRLVTGLEKENFQLFEGSSKEEIKSFSSEDAPVSLGVIFDSSGSMTSKMDRAKDAVIEFFKTANPQDEFFMITFSDEPEMVSDFTSSVDDIQGQAGLYRARANGPPCWMRSTWASARCGRPNIPRRRC